MLLLVLVTCLVLMQLQTSQHDVGSPYEATHQPRPHNGKSPMLFITLYKCYQYI